jgi:hypothetical protein
VRVTFTPGFDGLPVFSPNGKKLCWASGRTGDGKSQIFLADWNHEEALKALADAPKRVAADVTPQADQAASAAPDGKSARSLTSAATISVAGLKPAISAEDMKAEVGFLADDAHAGRATGSDGARLAADWLADYFVKAGLKPLPGQDGFFLPFEFNAGERLLPGKNTLHVSNGGDSTPLVLDKEFRTLAFSDEGVAEGEVVFAGYGLSVPEGAGQQRYNSYEGLDVKDKIVLILRYVPEDVEPARRAHLNRYSGLRYKAMMARERGAKAVLVVTGPNSPNAGELLPLTGDGSSAGSGIIAASITGDVATALLSPGGKNLKDLQKSLDGENPHAEGGFVLPKVTVKIATSVEHIHKMDRNVAACIPGETDEWVIVGAHYDHLGLGKGNSSLARAGEEGKIHPGADDNASGTSAVIEIAASLAAVGNYTGATTISTGAGVAGSPPRGWKPRRGIIFTLWSGEEIGLIGSNSFVEKPPVDLAKVVAYVNFDMVGRLKDNKLTMQAVGSSKTWMRLLEKRNVAAGFQLGLQEDPYLPTDVTSFYPKRIPVLNFFTGSHDDYHRPTDTADKVDYEGLERIAKFAEGIVRDVAMAPERPDFSRVERKEQGGGRDSMRAYLGSIPDYATEVKGVKLSGVRGGSPAEKGGLRGGDVIVEFGAQKIANIYDYTYALDAVKIGQPVKMIVEREGKRVELTVTPEARK